MSQEKYIGMDVHQATISVAVMDAGGKLILECLLETKAATMVEFYLEDVSVNEIGPACFGTESPLSRYAPSDNQK